jgi:RNA polymerase sigma factor (sigma-70 family)
MPYALPLPDKGRTSAMSCSATVTERIAARCLLLGPLLRKVSTAACDWMDSGMQGGPVDELLDVAVERPALDQLEVEVGRTLEDQVPSGLTGDHREERHLDAVRRNRLSERLRAQPVAVEVDDDRLSGRVHEALAALAPRDREVLLLAEWEGLTPAEMARVMHCPAVTIRGRLHRARRRFRAAFESQPDAAKASAHGPVSAQLSKCER